MLKQLGCILPILLIALAISGCSDDDSEEFLDTLQQNRAKWESLNANSYQFVYTKICFCLPNIGGPGHVLVSGNEVVSLANLDSGEGLRVSEFDTPTLDELFELIALEENREEELEVEYDPEYGYPTSIIVGRDGRFADDGYSIEISNVQLAQDIACTTEVRSGLSLTITDQDTQAPIACGTSIIAEEDSFMDTLINDSTGCQDTDPIEMLFERPGFYELTISKPGYQTRVIEELGIAQNLCGVITRNLSFELQEAN